eukprot:13312573-Ditylum_brightwellii.AAC.1
MERSKQNKHLVCNEDHEIKNGDDDGVNDCGEGADKHLAHLLHAADCCMTERIEQNKHLACNEDDDCDDGVDNCENDIVSKERSKQNKHLVYNEDNSVYNGVDNVDDDSVVNGYDGVVDNCFHGADKNLAHLSQAADYCMMERSKHNLHLVGNKDDDVDDDIKNGDDDSVGNGDDDSVDDGTE